MTARGAAGRCPPTTWLVPQLLLTCLLVSMTVTEEVLDYCSKVITNGHLTILQQLIDSQMETKCKIKFDFVDKDQLNDSVCYNKKAFSLMEETMEATLNFKDNTANANATRQLREVSVSLKGCITEDHEVWDKACVRTFEESPLELLEKIKEVFNETQILLKKDWKVFSKNCNDSFAQCSREYVVTKPDCNCLYPKAIPSSDMASVSLHQPLTPSATPITGLTWTDSKGTEDISLLSSKQPPHEVDTSSAKHRLSRSTYQSAESSVTPGDKGSPATSSPQPHPSSGTPTLGTENTLDSVLGMDWALEEASGEASEGPVPQRPELSPSRPGWSSIWADTPEPNNLLSASSPLAGSREGQEPALTYGTPLPSVGPVQPTGQAWNHTPEKADSSLALPRDHQETSSSRTPSLHPQGLSSSSTLSTQPGLPRSHSGGSVLPLGQLEGKRSTRDRRSPTELEGGRTSEGAAWPQTRFNSVPLTNTGQERQLGSSTPQRVVPSIILVLLAVGGLLFYRWKRRSRQEPQTVDSPMEQPEGSPLSQDGDRQVELPV